MTLAARVALQHAERLLVAREADLRARLQAEPDLWPAYLATISALSGLAPVLTPEAGGALLTTAELAERLGITPKSLLRRKARGELAPVLQAGKLLRWSGQERPAGRGRG